MLPKSVFFMKNRVFLISPLVMIHTFRMIFGAFSSKSVFQIGQSNQKSNFRSKIPVLVQVFIGIFDRKFCIENFVSAMYTGERKTY